MFENETVFWREGLNRLMSEIAVSYKTGFSSSGWAGRMTSPIFSALCHFCMFWILWFMALITGEMNVLARLLPACCCVLWTQMDTPLPCVHRGSSHICPFGHPNWMQLRTQEESEFSHVKHSELINTCPVIHLSFLTPLQDVGIQFASTVKPWTQFPHAM